MRRLKALMKKEFLHMLRDPRTLVTIFIMPILQLVLLGFVGGTDIKNVPTVIFDQDKTYESRALLESFRVTGYFTYDYVAYNQEDINRLIESGQAKVGIIIPAGYHD